MDQDNLVPSQRAGGARGGLDGARRASRDLDLGEGLHRLLDVGERRQRLLLLLHLGLLGLLLLLDRLQLILQGVELLLKVLDVLLERLHRLRPRGDRPRRDEGAEQGRTEHSWDRKPFTRSLLFLEGRDEAYSHDNTFQKWNL